MARVFRDKKSSSGLRLFIIVIIAIAILIAVWYLAGSLANTNATEQRDIARAAVVRSTVQCYAIEGRYPGSIDYLTENYGLTLDESKYIYYYRSVGSNMMPDIRVLSIGGSE
jgi:competence protein ComGC